jgi:hypothetical protein
METPGLGIKDFVDDVGQIVQNRQVRRKFRRRVTRRKMGPLGSRLSGNGSGTVGVDGVYHRPGTNSSDGLGEEDDYHHATVEDCVSDDSSSGHHPTVRFGDQPHSGGFSSPDKRDRSMSDGTGGGFKADDEDSDDLEML